MVRRFLILGVLFLLISGSIHAEDTPSEIRFVDTHLHLSGIYRGRVIRGLSPRAGRDPSPLQGQIKDYETAAENLLSYMDHYGVAKALIMPPPQIPGQRNVCDFSDLVPVVQKYPHRLVLVGGGDVLNPLIHGTEASEVTPEIRSQFETEARKLIQAGAKAFGEMTALHLSFTQGHVFEEVEPDHPLFLLLADLAAQYDVPIDLHMEAVPVEMNMPPGFERSSSNNPPVLLENISGLEHLLSHHPNARIVWQHIGWDNTGYMTVELLRRLLTSHPNLYLSLRVEERERTMAGTPMPNRIVDEHWRLRSEWVDLIREFPDRFMIGSDEFFGIPGKSRRMPQSFEETWSVLNQLPQDLAIKVGRDNAAWVYRL